MALEGVEVRSPPILSSVTESAENASVQIGLVQGPEYSLGETSARLMRQTGARG